MPRGKRSDDQTQISISITKDLLKEIDALADEDGRARSNWIVRVLERHVNRLKIEQAERSPKGDDQRKSA